MQIAIGRQAHDFVFVHVHAESEVQSENPGQNSQRMKGWHLLQNLNFGALPDSNSHTVDFAHAVTDQDQ